MMGTGKRIMTRILVIDDEDMVRLTLRRILEKEGYEVEEAENGVEGLALQRASPCDLLITDLIMPEKDGIETIIDFIKEFPETKIIAISGGRRTKGADQLKQAKALGADVVLAKPFFRDDVLKSVAEAMGE